jgi:ABC-type multidrug transport system permease subunit
VAKALSLQFVATLGALMVMVSAVFVTFITDSGIVPAMPGALIVILH